MPRTYTKLAASFLSTTLLAGATRAAVISIPDFSDLAGSYEVPNAIAPVSGEASVYIVGTMTFNEVTQRFHVVELAVTGGGTTAYQWGKNFDAGPLVTDPRTYQTIFPIGQVFTSSLSNNDAITTVLKIDQTNGDYTWWMNPDLGDLEANNAPFQTGTGGPTGAITEVSFRGGFDGAVDYTGFAAYTGDDTPFVPEPTSLALLGLGGPLMTRRRGTH
ncbi:MAG: PEP-CTERM sorting domain-containing protein [Planctomycetota bacterium]